MDGAGRILRRVGAATIAAPGLRWFAELVQSGTDLNGARRTQAMLTAAAHLFEGRPVKVLPAVDNEGRPLNDHQKSDAANGREVLNVVGTLANVRYDDAAFAGSGGLVGDVVLADKVAAAQNVQGLLESFEKDGGLAKHTLGLSFNGFGRKDASGNEVIESVESVDVVTHPAAGGRIAHRLAASRSATMTLQQLIASIQAKCSVLADGLPQNVATEYALGKHLAAKLAASADLRKTAAAAFGIEETKLVAADAGGLLDQVMALLDQLRQAVGGGGGGAPGQASAPAVTPAVTPAVAGVTPVPVVAAAAATVPDPIRAAASALPPEMRARFETAIGEVERAATASRLSAACDVAKLPAYAKTRLLASYANQVLDAAACEKIAREKAAELDEVVRQSASTRATVTEEPQERLTAALACFFSARAPKPQGLDPVRDHGGSLNLFLERHFGIDVRKCRMGRMERVKLRAAVDATNLDAMFGDGMNRALLAEYRGDEAFVNPWRSIVNVVSESDFRTKEVIAGTWYGEIPDVAEGAAYTYATTPTDRKETYALSKRGILETITWEKMLNDDLGIWRSMLSRLARSFRETLNERVFAKVRRATQPTMADGYKLTSSSRTGDVNEGTSNLTADATGWDNFVSTVTMMMGLKGGAGKAKGVRPSTLIIPLAKSRVAGSLFSDFSPAATDIPTRRGLEILKAQIPNVVIDFGTGDANDWFLMADPSDAEVLRVAFLGGREDPEVYLANNDTFGAMFTNDRIEVKGRHVYGVGAVDYLGIAGHAASA